MPRRRKDVRMIVTISVPAKMRPTDAIGEARLQLANGLMAWGTDGVKLVSAKPVPASGMVHPRKPPKSRARLPLIDYLNQENDNAD